VNLTDKEKKFLTYFVNNCMAYSEQNNGILAGNLSRVIGIDQTKVKVAGNGPISQGTFNYNFLHPHLTFFEDKEMKDINKIMNKDILKFLYASNARVDLPSIIQSLDIDDAHDKGIRIAGIVFNAIARLYAENEITNYWKKYMFYKNLKPETKKHFGGIFDELKG
jgi:hypothetical protein